MTKDKHILIKNIYYMLSYAFHALRQHIFDDVATEEFDNIHALFAAILSKGIAQQLKQGLTREYIPFAEDLPVLRGKLDMPGTIRHAIARRRQLACNYDALAENTLLNQIIKTTAQLLAKSGDVPQRSKDVLRKELLLFAAVDTVDLQHVAWTRLRFHRNNQTYRMLVGICQLISEGLLLTTDKGEQRLATFVDDQQMCRLYEKFLLEYYCQEHPSLHAAATQIAWATDDGMTTLLPTMKSDIMLSNDKAILIIDAKYYRHTTQTYYDTISLHSANLYQIFTYVKNKTVETQGQQTVGGVLLYALPDDEPLRAQTYHLSGNRIDVCTLDLNTPFSRLREQLDALPLPFLSLSTA